MFDSRVLAKIEQFSISPVITLQLLLLILVIFYLSYYFFITTILYFSYYYLFYCHCLQHPIEIAAGKCQNMHCNFCSVFF